MVSIVQSVPYKMKNNILTLILLFVVNTIGVAQKPVKESF